MSEKYKDGYRPGLQMKGRKRGFGGRFTGGRYLKSDSGIDERGVGASVIDFPQDGGSGEGPRIEEEGYRDAESNKKR